MHKKIEEMRGIHFCGECGEEISTVIGLPKGGFWKHGQETRKNQLKTKNYEGKCSVINFRSK